MNSQPEIQINLINYKLEKEISRQSTFFEWGVFVLIGALVIGGIFLYNHGLERQIDALNKENISLQSELKQSTIQASALQTTRKIEAAVKTRGMMVSTLTKNQNNFVPVLDELGQMNDSGLLISKIDVQPDTINVKGYASGHSQLIKLLQSLRDSKYFSDPANLQIATDEDTGEISFSMQMSLEVAKE